MLVLASPNLLRQRSTGPGVIADLDFRVPLASWTDGRTGFSSAFSDIEWDFQTFDAGYDSVVGSDKLTVFGTNQLFSQQAVAVHDGVGYGNRNAYEHGGVVSFSNYLYASNATTFDTDTDDLSGRLVFSITGNPTASATILDRMSAGIGGWRLRFGSAGAQNISIQIHDGTNYYTATVLGNFRDGALHYVKWLWDASANLLYIETDIGAATPASTATRVGGITSPLNMSVCRFGIGPMQLHHLSGAVGVNAVSHFNETFWQHGGDPTALLTTTSRSTPITVPANDNSVATFSGGTTVGTCQLPIGYHADLEAGAGGFGLHTNSAVVNKINESEIFNASGLWGGVSCPAVDYDHDSPEGFRGATLLTQTGINGRFRYSSGAVLTSSTQYTASIWLRADTPHTATILLSDGGTSDTALPGAQLDVALTTEWQRFEVTGTTGGAQTSYRFLIYPGQIGVGTAETCHAWGAQVELGNHATGYIRTTGSSATLAFSNYSSTTVPARSLAGEIKATWITHQTDDHYLFYTRTGVTINNHVVGYVLPSLQPRMFWANNVGGIEDNHPALLVDAMVPGEEYTARWLWDTSGIDGYETILFSNGGVRKNGAAMPLEGTINDVTCNDFIIGSSGSSTFALDGVIARVQVFDGPGAL